MLAFVKGDGAQGLGGDISGENDDRNRANTRTNIAGQTQSVHAVWQIVVRNDQAGPAPTARDHFHGFHAVNRRRYLVSFGVERGPQKITHLRNVLDDQNRTNDGRVCRVVPTAARLCDRVTHPDGRSVDVDGEDGSLPELRTHCHHVPQQRAEPFDDGKAQSHTESSVLRRIAQLTILSENIL